MSLRSTSIPLHEVQGAPEEATDNQGRQFAPEAPEEISRAGIPQVRRV